MHLRRRVNDHQATEIAASVDTANVTRAGKAILPAMPDYHFSSSPTRTLTDKKLMGGEPGNSKWKHLSNDGRHVLSTALQRGFTLIELMVVLVIITGCCTLNLSQRAGTR
jgi:prepilin-type N-terminal cleavage/methylation domain-containing protein